MFTQFYKRLRLHRSTASSTSTCSYIKGVSQSSPTLINTGTNTPIESLDQLLDLCEPAPLAYGDQTILDTSLRNVLQSKPNTVGVQWDGLAEAVHKSQTLVQVEEEEEDGYLNAEFYKVLVYQDGAFFTWHRDHKDKDNLVASLAVNIEYLESAYQGGIVEFSNPEHSVEKGVHKVLESWDSQGGTNWAAWMTSQYHRITSVDHGCRVVATYKLYWVQKEKEKHGVKRKACSSGGSEFMHYSERFGLLDCVDEISRYLAFDEAKQLNLVCTEICKKVQKKLNDLSFYFSQNLWEIKDMLRESFASRIGFVLSHQYSFDGKEELADLKILRGKDKKIYDIMAKIGKVHVRPCEVRTEVLDRHHFDEEDEGDGYDDPYFPISIRICIPLPEEHLDVNRFFDRNQMRRIYRNDESDSEYENVMANVPDHLKPYFQTDQIHRQELDIIHDISRKYDGYNGDEDFEDFPFRGVLWVTPKKFVQKVVQYLECFSEHHDFWGNELTFGIYRYQSCVLLVDIMKQEEIDYRLEFAEDY